MQSSGQSGSDASSSTLTYPTVREAVRGQIGAVILWSAIFLLVASVEMLARLLARPLMGGPVDNPLGQMLEIYAQIAVEWSATFATNAVWWAPAAIAVSIGAFEAITGRLRVPGEDPRTTRNTEAMIVSLLAGAAAAMWIIAAPTHLITSGTAASLVPSGILTAIAVAAGVQASRFRSADRKAIVERELRLAEDGADWLAPQDPGQNLEVSHWKRAARAAGFTVVLALIVGAVFAVILALTFGLDPWRVGFAFASTFLVLSGSLSMIMAARLSTRRQAILKASISWVTLVLSTMSLSIVVSAALMPLSVGSLGSFLTSLICPALLFLLAGSLVHAVGTDLLTRAPWLADWLFPWAVIALQRHVADVFLSRAQRRVDIENEIMPLRLRA